MSITLSEEQQYAVDRIKSGANVLLTSEAGCGKSVVVNHVKDENTVLVGPTGISSLLIGGATAHKTFSLPTTVPTPNDFMQVPRKVQDLFNPMSPVNKIIIDEASCLRLDMFELINSRLQLARRSNRPFGGISLVLVADYFQLPPIVSKWDHEAYYSQYDSKFNFDSDLFNFELVELTKVFRQSDERQAAMLRSIREKTKYYKFALDTIVKEAKPYVPSPDTCVVCCYKSDVKKYNRKYFRMLDTPIYKYKAKIQKILSDDAWKESSVAHDLELRVGAKVMFRCNDKEGSFVNGERGQVVDLCKVSVKVKKENGTVVDVLPNTWERYQYSNKFGVLEKEVTSTFTQIPLDLAYSMSSHLAQGQTLDNVAIDVGAGCFDSSQLYVMLSRCKDLRNISFVKPPQYSDVIVDKRVKEFYRRLRNE